MSTREEKIDVKVTGADQSERGLDKVSDAAKGVGESVTVMGRESEKASKKVDDLGDEAKGTASDLSRLDRQIAETRTTMATLNKEFERTGDAKVSKEFDKQAAALAKLESRAKTVAKINKQIADDAERAAKRRRDQAPDLIPGDGKRRPGLIGSLLGTGQGATGGLAGAFGDLPAPMKLAIGGLAVSAAPAAGGAVGGALLAGGALGGVGLGVAGAIANNPEPFRKAWTEDIAEISRRWQDASTGFEKPTLSAMATIKHAVDAVDFEGPLKDAEKYVEPLARGLGSLLTGIGNGFGKLVSKAGPVVDVLAARLPEIGVAIDHAFGRIGDSSEGAAAALSDVLKVVRMVILGVGDMIGFLSDVYGKTVEIRKGISDLVGVDIFGDQDAMMQNYARTLHSTTTSTFDMVQAQKEMADAATKARDALRTEMDQLLGLEGANDAVVVSQANLKKSFDDNGASLSGNSQKALDNRAALRDLAQAYEEQWQKAVDAAHGSGAAIKEANLAYLGHLEDLRKIEKQHGADTTALDKYIDDFKRMNGLTVDTYIKVHYNDAGVPKNLANRGPEGYAAGGNVTSSGFKLVGENGPEIAWMNQNQYVSTAQQTRALLGGAGGSTASWGGGLTVVVAAGGDTYLGQLIQKLFDANIIQVFAGGQLVTTRP